MKTEMPKTPKASVTRNLTSRWLIAALCAGLPMGLYAAESGARNPADPGNPGTQPSAHILLVDALTATSQGYLGVQLKDVSQDELETLKLKDLGGAEVIGLDHDGPGAQVGMKEHDVILQMNGQPVGSVEQLRRMLRETPSGRKAVFEVSRDGQPVHVEVVLGDRAANERQAWDRHIDVPDPSIVLPAMSITMPDLSGLSDMKVRTFSSGNGLIGAAVDPLGPQLANFFGARDGVGLLVKNVAQNGVAAKAGLRAGDVITKANGQPTPGYVELSRILRENRGKPVKLSVLREKRNETIVLTPPLHDHSVFEPQSLETPDMKVLEDSLAAMNADSGEKIAGEMADMQTQIDSGVFQKRLEDAMKQGESASTKVESKEFQKQLKEAQEALSKTGAKWKINMPQLEEQLEDSMQVVEPFQPFD